MNWISAKLKSFVDKAEAGDEVEIITNQTPFYAESGGQVGDQGLIYSNDCRVVIKDTQKKMGDLHVHLGKIEKGILKINQSVNLEIDIEKRLNPKFEGKFKIMLVPNITNISYGRGVGYKIEEVVLPEEIQKISATKIRAKMREDGKLK